MEHLLLEHGPTRDDVLAWAKNEVKIETQKYKEEKKAKTVLIPFHADRQLDFDKQAFFRGGYLFLQSVYYQLQMNKICRKLKRNYKFKYDINAILSDLIYTRILEPCSKRSSFKAASEFLEKPSYVLHDVYRALDVLGAACDLIQAEVYKNSHFLGKRNDTVLYYDCSNYYFEIEQEDGCKKYGKSKEHKAQAKSYYSNGPVHGRERDSPCFLTLSGKGERADISGTLGAESSWGFRMPEI